MKERFPALNVMTSKLAMRLGAIATVAALNFLPFAALAGDPFRSSNSHKIGEKTEAAFKAIFERGNYAEAKQFLQEAESKEADEPLIYAMRASLAFMEEDMETLKSYADKTLEKAQKLNGSDRLRGNLYRAVGHFLQGSYSFQKEGPLGAVGQLQQVFQYLDEAKKVAPDDPELNLIKGYMDLMLSVNLPFSDPTQAIEILEKNGKPLYLVERGLALGYRDLKQYDKAQQYVDKALSKTPDNPELNYLKAQILVKQEKQQQAKQYFTAALTKPNQMPKSLVGQIFYEYCRNERKIDNKQRDCRALRNKIKETSGSWGPVSLPALD